MSGEWLRRTEKHLQTKTLLPSQSTETPNPLNGELLIELVVFLRRTPKLGALFKSHDTHNQETPPAVLAPMPLGKTRMI